MLHKNDSDYSDLTSDSGEDSDSDDEVYFSVIKVPTQTSHLKKPTEFIGSKLNGCFYSSEPKNSEVFC